MLSIAFPFNVLISFFLHKIQNQHARDKNRVRSKVKERNLQELLLIIIWRIIELQATLLHATYALRCRLHPAAQLEIDPAEYSYRRKR